MSLNAEESPDCLDDVCERFNKTGGEEVDSDDVAELISAKRVGKNLLMCQVEGCARTFCTAQRSKAESFGGEILLPVFIPGKTLACRKKLDTKA